MYMGRHFSGETYQNKGKGVLLVNKGTANIKGEIHLSSKWKSGASYPQTSDIIINTGGTMNVEGRIYFNEMCSRQAITVNGGTLNAKGGLESLWTASNCYRSRNSSLTVKSGGVFATNGPLYFNTYVSSGERITFDNGTLKVLSSFTTHAYQNYESQDVNCTIFTIGAGGMKIDTQGNTLTWNTAISSGSGKITKEGSGTLAFGWTCSATGGIDVKTGTLSVTGSNTYFNGPVTVKNGATIKNAVGNTTDKLGTSVTFEEGAKLAVPAADGVLSVITAPAISIQGTTTVSFPNGFPGGRQTILTMTGSGSFTAEDAAKLSASGGNVEVRVSSNGKSIEAMSAQGAWTGAIDNNLDVAGNWSDGVVPHGTPAYISLPSAATLTHSEGGDFAPLSITFSGAAAVTISGEGSISGIAAVTNLSTSVSATFLSPVVFAEGETIEVYHTATYADTFSYGNVNGMVWFKGGVTGYDVRQNTDSGRSNIYAGEYRRTTTASDFKATQGGTYRNVVYKNSSLTVDTATDIWELGIESGGAFTTRVATVRDDGTYSRLCWRNDGEIVATEELVLTANRNAAGYLSLTADSAKGNVYKAGKLTIAGSDWVRLSNKSSNVDTTTVFVGDGGIVFNDSGSRFSTGAIGTQNGTTTIRPWHGDFEIGERTGTAHSIAVNKNTVFDTNDESGTGRRITVNAIVGNTKTVSVTGSGTVRYNRVNDNNAALTVSGTATLELGADAKTGTGAVTVSTGAALSVPEAGTGTVGGNLTLQSGAKLSFAIGGVGDGPKISMASGKTVDVSGVTAANPVTVSFSTPGDDRIRSFEPYVLIQGAGLAAGDAEKFSLADNQPAWVESLAVVDGDLVLVAKRPGLTLSVR